MNKLPVPVPPLSLSLSNLSRSQTKLLSLRPLSLQRRQNLLLLNAPLQLHLHCPAPLLSISCCNYKPISLLPHNASAHQPNITIEVEEEPDQENNFWAAVSLIIGTAVGPGMLGLPACTIKSGLVPSILTIFISWIYVISSIILVAELTFATMEQSNLEEVSFTGIASNTLGATFATFVAIIYALLSFSLIIACVSGIGSLVSKQFPSLNPILANAIFPIFVGILIACFPFQAIDQTNRLLCGAMLVSICTLVAFGISVGRNSLLASLSFASWMPQSILPAIPVTVLTLGFHVITPFICKIAGSTVYDARKAILVGGSVPLAMVLSWNAVILGLAGKGNIMKSSTSYDPINLLLSVNPSVLPAVQVFAFTALATSLIGYAVSFPKQLTDTILLVLQRFHSKNDNCLVGETRNLGVTWAVLLVPIFIAGLSGAAFSKALDFAGVYANCFLFGVLPPVMAWIHRSRRKKRSADYSEDILPGGHAYLFVLFAIAVVLGFWH
ncbi:Tyrosine-specific transport protein [Rhynchospora pubera]|uniref:Tyrosine-specific transport protein n=1 Tax=Rhynchospora pubera TaxID=906938 RepID=A0AAV8C1G1_9POAL|nr:Tyrosine-specific transport protein [Rhynchospora pubera]